MAKPPAGSSLLFGALADSGQIKQRKKGSYRMVLKGVDEIDWFTDRPFRSEGLWKPQKLISQWESFFETSDPNAQASFKVGEERELITFEMFKPKYNDKKQKFSFKIDAGIINERENDLVAGLKGKALNEVTLFIDDAVVGYNKNANTDWCRYRTKLAGVNLAGQDLKKASLICADLAESDLSEADLTGVPLSGVDISNANLMDARLRSADLRNADLTGVNLTGAWLAGARLIGADLTDADLSYANLSVADLTEANLNGANMNGVNWRGTICPDGTLNSGTSPCTAEQLNLA